MRGGKKTAQGGPRLRAEVKKTNLKGGEKSLKRRECPIAESRENGALWETKLHKHVLLSTNFKRGQNQILDKRPRGGE